MADTIQSQNVRVRKPLTQERLKELLHYDPATGVFTWIATKARRIRNGDEAATVRTLPNRTGLTYRFINVDYRISPAHALAWLYVFGVYPGQIDHKDGNGLNNSIGNLRLCTDAQNRANTKRLSSNKSGLKGVSWSANAERWRATANFERRQIHLGYFDSPEDAHAAYAAKARELFGEFARVE